jgi:hypothetical protein
MKAYSKDLRLKASKLTSQNNSDAGGCRVEALEINILTLHVLNSRR